MPRWVEVEQVNEATWNAREDRIAELEKTLSDIHASTRRMSFTNEWYLEGLRNPPGDYVLMRLGPVTSDETPF